MRVFVVNQDDQDEQEPKDNGDQLVDENRRLKSQLDKLVRRIRTILGSLPFGLIIARTNQRINALNAIAEDYFGYTADELKQKPVSHLFPDVDYFGTFGTAMRATGRKKSGELFATEVVVNALEIDGDELLFISVQDVNEKQKLEQMRQELVAMVSHDLRAPLTSVRLTLEMLAEGTYGEISERGRGLVGAGISSVEYLNSLVGNLLESEKAESGSIELHYRDTTVGAIIERAVATVLIPGREAEVEIVAEVNNDAITVDPDRIVQVLINLISNAIKYSPAGQQVTVRGGIEGVHAKFQVIDRGPGIPENMKSVVFQRFRQLEQPDKKKRAGFGLGLAICKALVEKHRGRIWVESEEGTGSKFCFSVPISPEDKQ